MKPFKRFGPGLLVMAAFIGPGTITTATKAGAQFGFALAWVIIFAVIAAIVLQEMAARLGLVTRKGLGEALRTTIANPTGRWIVAALVVAAITVGNTAYQTGNITGAAMGLEALLGANQTIWVLVVALAAAALLACGTYRIIERALMALVGLMSIVFITTAIVAKPGGAELWQGIVTPTLPGGSLTLVIALIGTTVVPYNLFLHASTVSQKWPTSIPTEVAIRASRLDTTLSVLLGGAITLAVLVTAAVFLRAGTNIDSAVGMAKQLQPLLGAWAKYFFAVGLLAAGLTSAITAPLAAAYATSGALGFEPNLRSWRFRGVWISIMVIGAGCAILAGRSPTEAIIFAQAANGLILPLIAVFLLVVMNRKRLLGRYTNTVGRNVLGALVVLVVSGLGFYKIYKTLMALFT